VINQKKNDYILQFRRYNASHRNSEIETFIILKGFLDPFLAILFDGFVRPALIPAKHTCEEFKSDKGSHHQACNPPPRYTGKRSNHKVFQCR